MDVTEIEKRIAAGDAAAVLDEIGPLGDDTLEEYILCAEVLMRRQRYDEAGKILGPIQEKYPKNGHVQFCLGSVAIWQGEFDAAREHYDSAIALGYVTYRSLTSSAVLEKALGDEEKAEDLLRRASRLKIDSPIPRVVLLSHFLSEKKYRQAIKLAVELQNDYPEDYNVFRAELFALTALKENGRALERLERIRDRFGDNKQFIYDYATVLLANGREQDAWTYFSQNEDTLEHDTAQYSYMKAMLASRVHKAAEAASAFGALYEEHGVVSAGLDLAVLCIMENDFAKADQYLQQILQAGRRDPGRYAALFMHAKCLEGLGEDADTVREAYRQAIGEYEAAYEKSSLNSYVMEFAKECYQYLGDQDNVRRCEQIIQQFNARVEEQVNADVS